MAPNGQPNNVFCNPRIASAAHVDKEGSADREPIEKDSDDSGDESPREPGQVKVGEYGTGSGSVRIHTDGLSTCARIAVTGKYRGGSGSNGRVDRFLAHVADSINKAALQGLINGVLAAKRSGLEISEAIVIATDTAMRQGFDRLDKTDRDEKEDQDEFNALVVNSINLLVGNATMVKVLYHDEDNHHEMSIEGNKEIICKDGKGKKKEW